MSRSCVPPAPQKPSPQECCGRGCVPCIFDYYHRRLEEWNLQYGSLNGHDKTDKTLVESKC